MVAYFSRTGTDRQLAHGTFNETRADIFARSALDIVVADLKQEIVAGSSAATVDGYTIYTPTANANILPVTSGTPADKSIPNLVKRSVATDPASRASGVNSTAASLNGRAISPARWNKHYLLPRVSPTPSSQSDTTPTASFVAPDWVLITRNGPTPVPSWTASLRDATATNSNFVTGRYAYTVYDEGGLLDVNVAGYPSPAPSPATYTRTIGRKGGVSFADLTQSGMSSGGVGDLIGWRNYASIQPGGVFKSFTFDSAAADRYVSAVLSNSNGFTSVSGAVWQNGTDQAFTSRQSLIQFQKSSGFTVGALPYLGTFSRELNRPSWKPATPTAINPDLSAVRVPVPFMRADGTMAVVGEPVFKNRFPLPRINELTDTANVYLRRDFGLLWDASNKRWNYVGASGSTVQTSIKTLAQVAGENREPNFFEVLKAVVLNGSIGLGSGSANTFVAAEAKYYSTTGGLSADHQIMQIGANIIDAWDTDNVPIFINFGGNELSGVENLPYLNKLVLDFWISNNGNGGAHDQIDGWLVPSLWNPHQNASAAPVGQNVRFAMTSGSVALWVTVNDGTTAIQSSPIPNPATGGVYPFVEVMANAFATACPPVPLPAPGSKSPPGNESGPKAGPVTVTTQGSRFYDGLDFGNPVDTFRNNAWKVITKIFPIFEPNTNFEMQVNVNGTWKAYQTWKGCNNGTSPTTNPPSGNPIISSQGASYKNNSFQDPEFVSLDPRTVRFGVWASDASHAGTNNYDAGAEDTLDQRATSGGLESVSAMKPQPPAAFPMTSPNGLGYLYAANTSTTDYYKDLDGVKRPGDSLSSSLDGVSNTKTIMYGSASPPPTPSPTPRSVDRPQILSAPFQSVAELGQVFRDQPWKTLNFTSASTGVTSLSGDAGLLDAFTMQDAPMVAGKTSLNTRQTSVLKSILSQAALNLTATNIISTAQRDAIITALVNLTTAAPMISKGELVTRLAADASVTSLGNKEAREAVMRAFSDACQTRTWNLMIDVIAQSGRYPPTATGLANFIVEGEKRYWLHVAIDRFTGEIIDQQLEAVYE